MPCRIGKPDAKPVNLHKSTLVEVMNFNRLNLSVEICSKSNPRTIDGISMDDCAFIGIQIDGVNLLEESFYEGGLPVFEELANTLNGDGNYLIFTCACGVADDGGWNTVEVSHQGGLVGWVIRRGDCILEYHFDGTQYSDTIHKLTFEVHRLQKEGVRFEPENPVFPEC